MIEPVQRDTALVSDILARAADHSQLRLWWLGQSGFLLQWAGRHLLFDPYLSDSLTLKYATTDKPHVRMTARAVDPAALDFIDIVTSSHNHTDHLDAETLGPLLRVNPTATLVVPAVNRAFAAQRLGIDEGRPVGLEIGGAVDVGPFRIEAVPAAHEAVDPQFVGYVVRCDPGLHRDPGLRAGGGWTIYHSGDTLLYDGMAERLRPFGIDVALLPINGRAPERRVAGNLNPTEAAALAKAIGARTVIPCHYEMFTFNTGDPSELVEACARIGQRCDVLRCGERWDSGLLKDDGRGGARA